jgi:hypothetical protein
VVDSRGKNRLWCREHGVGFAACTWSIHDYVNTNIVQGNLDHWGTHEHKCRHFRKQTEIPDAVEAKLGYNPRRFGCFDLEGSEPSRTFKGRLAAAQVPSKAPSLLLLTNSISYVQSADWSRMCSVPLLVDRLQLARKFRHLQQQHRLWDFARKCRTPRIPYFDWYVVKFMIVGQPPC